MKEECYNIVTKIVGNLQPFYFQLLMMATLIDFL